jgi:hypothetical protein
VSAYFFGRDTQVLDSQSKNTVCVGVSAKTGQGAGNVVQKWVAWQRRGKCRKSSKNICRPSVLLFFLFFLFFLFTYSITI